MNFMNINELDKRIPSPLQEDVLATSAPVRSYPTDLSRAGSIENLNAINPVRFKGAITWRDLPIPDEMTLAREPVETFGMQIYRNNGDTVTWHREKAAEIVFPLVGQGVMKIQYSVHDRHEIEEISYPMIGSIAEADLELVDIWFDDNWLYGSHKVTGNTFRVEGILTRPGQSHTTVANGEFVCVVQKTRDLVS